MRPTDLGWKDPREVVQAPQYNPHVTKRGDSLNYATPNRVRPKSSQARRFYDPSTMASTTEFVGPGRYTQELDTISYDLTHRTHSNYKGEMLDSKDGAYVYVGYRKVFDLTFASAEAKKLRSSRQYNRSMDLSSSIRAHKKSSISESKTNLDKSAHSTTMDTPLKGPGGSINISRLLHPHHIPSNTEGVSKTLESQTDENVIIQTPEKGKGHNRSATQSSATKLPKRFDTDIDTEVYRLQLYKDIDYVRQQISSLEKKRRSGSRSRGTTARTEETLSTNPSRILIKPTPQITVTLPTDPGSLSPEKKSYITSPDKYRKLRDDLKSTKKSDIKSSFLKSVQHKI